MCAIIGYAAKREPDTELVIRLFRESKIRGLHAFGYSYLGPYSALCTEKFLNFEDLEAKLRAFTPKLLIGHCRYSTSGDWRNPENNQPIVRGNALVFNGVIDMGTKQEMEARYGVLLENENDGELLLSSGKEPLDFVRDLPGSFAGILLTPSGAFALRNERRPAYVGYRGGDVCVASTSDILVRAGLIDIEEIEPLKVVRFGWTD